MTALCDNCDSPLTASANVQHYQRTGEYRYDILCPGGCFSRPATEDDLGIIEDAAERYGMRSAS